MLEKVPINEKSQWHRSIATFPDGNPGYINDRGHFAMKTNASHVSCEHCGTFWYTDGHPGTSPCIHLQEISRLAGYDMTLGEVVGAE